MKEINNTVFLNNLIKFRKAENLTQEDVAKYLGIDQSLVSMIERGERRINSSLLEKLSVLYCCPVYDLLYSEDIAPIGKVAFRHEGLDFEDECILANVNKIILNQIEMDRLINNE